MNINCFWLWTETHKSVFFFYDLCFTQQQQSKWAKITWSESILAGNLCVALKCAHLPPCSSLYINKFHMTQVCGEWARKKKGIYINRTTPPVLHVLYRMSRGAEDSQRPIIFWFSCTHTHTKYVSARAKTCAGQRFSLRRTRQGHFHYSRAFTTLNESHRIISVKTLNSLIQNLSPVAQLHKVLSKFLRS